MIVTQCQRLKDGQTSRRTDGFTIGLASTALCIASYMPRR